MSGAGGGDAAARDEVREGGELAADDRDRAAVVANEVDGDEDDQADFDGLGDVGGGEIRTHDGPGHDGRRGIADEPDPDDPAEPDGERERDDDGDGGDGIAQGVQGEQQAAQGGMDVGGAEDQGDDGGADDHVAGAKRGASGEHRVDLSWMKVPDGVPASDRIVEPGRIPDAVGKGPLLAGPHVGRRRRRPTMVASAG